jgi:hypothetical protein
MAKSKAVPFNVRIGHMDIKVIPISSRKARDLECLGYYEHEDRIIGIKHPMPIATQVETLIHEILHAIMDIWKYESPMDEEAICSNLDWPLTKVLQDNPHLLAIIALALGPMNRGIFQP